MASVTSTCCSCGQLMNWSAAGNLGHCRGRLTSSTRQGVREGSDGLSYKCDRGVWLLPPLLWIYNRLQLACLLLQVESQLQREGT